MPPSLRKVVAAAIGGGAIAIASVLITGPSGNDGLEGVSYIPYKDIVGVWTVCHGHTGKDIMLGKTYTKAECKTLLNKDLATVARQINPYIKVDIPEEKSWGLGRIVTEIFEEVAEAHLIQPTFITEYPAEVSPLARRNDINPEITDRFEFFIGGREIGNGFSELNDAEDQAQRFLDQVAAKDAGDDEAMFYDEDYVTALEHGLPPTAGLGIGIDRMVMLFTNSHTIRDVILFPAMRPVK